MARLDGKVALLSGAARGMGAAEARLFAREGARVILGDVLEREIRAIAAEINGAAGTEVAIALVLDVQKAADWTAAVEVADARWGGVDILVNNAAIVRSSDIETATEDEWQSVIGINLTGTWLGMKTVAPSMRRRGGGSMINISSIGGLIGTPGYAAYHAAKGAVRMLAKHGAVAFAKDGIRCNTLFPGPILTPMLESLMPDKDAHDATVASTVLKRLGRPEEIAYAALFLASNESSYVTGADLAVDGGYTAV
jgi:cyclopentanol dehydrogenase